MYNGIGLTTPRGSGTNGHVQRNWAFVRPGKKDNNYRNEEDVKKLDATLNRPPNKEILDHDRKRKMEVKCLEFEEILEKQGFTPDEIKAKVDSYRQKLMGQSKNDLPKDEFGRVAVRETHQVAEAQQQKNAKLREAFNISEYFVEGSSFDSDRKAKEDLAKSLSLQKELDAQREHTASGASAVAARCSDNQKRGYNVMRTPSKESEKQLAASGGGGGGGATCSSDDHSVKKKKKKRMRESSASPERKKDKKKKSKKHKKENKPKKKKSRKCKEGITESEADSDKGSDDDDGGGDSSDSEYGIKKAARKRNKKDKKKRDKKRKRDRRSTSSEKSNNKLSSRRSIETKKSSRGELNSSKGPADNVFGSNDSRQRRTSRDKHRSSDTRRYTSSRNSRSGERTTRQQHQDRYKSRTRRSRDRRPDDNERCSRSRQRRMGEYQQRKYSKERSTSCRTESGDKRRKRNYSCSSTTPPGRSQAKKREKSRSARKNSRSRSRTHLSRRSHDRKPLDKMKRSRSCSNSPRIKKRKQYSNSPSVQRELNQENKKNVSNEVKQNKPSEKKNMTAAFRVKNDRRKSHSSSNTNTLSDSDSSRQSRPPERGAEKSKVIKKSKSFEKAKGSTEKLYRSPSQKDATLLQKQCRREDSRRSTDCNNPRNVISSSSNERTLKKSKTPTSVPAPLHKTKSDIKASRSLSRDSSELSYSPARRNPERYRDILETSGKNKSDRYEVENRRGNDYKQRKQSHNARSTNKRGNDDFEKDKPTSSRREIDNRHERDRGNVSKLAPVVRLHSQSEGENDSDGNPEHNADNMASALNEFQESRRERELKELKMLEHLKTGIAAKAKEKIKTIEKMAAIGGSSGMAGSEVSNICGYGRRSMRHTLNETFSDNASIAITSSNTNTNTTNKNKNDNRLCNKDAAIYPQNRPDIKIEQLSPSHTPDDLGSVNKEDNEAQANCKQSHTLGANGHAYTSPTETETTTTTTTTTTTMTTTTSTLNNIQIQPNNNIRDRGRKREYEREPDKPDSNNYNRDRNYNYKRDRDNERSRRSPLQQQQQYGPNSANMVGGVGMTVGRRQQHLYYRGRHNGNTNNNGGGAAGHPLLTHASSTSHSQNCGGHGTGALMPGPPYAHPINTSTALTYNRPSRINNTPLITATQFNNQMLCKQSGNVLVGRRNHRTALSLGLSGTPTTNFTNSNLLLTKANALHLQGHHPHHHHHHHHQHHHHHHSSSSHINHTSTQITDRILMAASLAAAGQHNHALTYNHNAATAVNSLSYLQQQQQQQKSKILIKPFKINHDSQPLVAALADSTLVDTIVSKVSTATVRAQESAARRSRSRSRRSRSRSRHHDSTGRRSKSRSRSRSSSSSSRTRSRSSRSRSHSHSSKSSTSSRSSSCSSSSSSSGLSRSGSRSPSIPRRRGSPSFLDRRRITSARKRPIPYHRKTPSDITSCYCSSCCSRDSSQRSQSFSPMQNSRSPSTMIF